LYVPDNTLPVSFAFGRTRVTSQHGQSGAWWLNIPNTAGIKKFSQGENVIKPCLMGSHILPEFDFSANCDKILRIFSGFSTVLWRILIKS
jgi:hypothetical protein